MVMFSFILLLAASSGSTLAGPVPQNHKRQSPFNPTNDSSADYPNHLEPSPVLSQGISSAAKSYELSSPSPQTNTAIIVQPIRPAVLTSIIPGVTFINPNGKPLVTYQPETLLATLFLMPTAPSATDKNPNTTPRPSLSVSLKGGPRYSLNNTGPAVYGSNSFGTSTTVPSGPMFTLKPTMTTDSVVVGSTSSNVRIRPSKASSVSTFHSSNAQVTPSTFHSHSDESVSCEYVTQTEYTTVYPTPAKATSPGYYDTPYPAATPSGDHDYDSPKNKTGPPIATSSTADYDSYDSPTVLSSSGPAAFPTTQLTPPPLVIVAQPTTVTPPVNNPSPGAYKSPLELPPVVIVTRYTTVTPVAAGEATPVSSSKTPPVESPIYKPVPLSSPTTTVPPPQPTPALLVPGTPSIPAPPADTGKNEGPLIITPINPSQIYTVTVTATEKVTIKETATVTVTIK